MPLHALARAGLAVTLLLGLVGTAHALTLKSEEFKTHRRPANGASDESVPSECSRMASMILSYLWQAPQVVGPLFWAVWHSMQFLW